MLLIKVALGATNQYTCWSNPYVCYYIYSYYGRCLMLLTTKVATTRAQAVPIDR